MERPILFSGEMVRAILGGRKDQTRRVMSPQPTALLDGNWGWAPNQKGQIDWVWWTATNVPGFVSNLCPHGASGDRLWVREAWAVHQLDAYGGTKEYPNVLYRADSSTRLIIGPEPWKYVEDKLRWRPSIHMPRWASRITLEITGVRVQRVQDISEEDAKAEGVKPMTWQSNPEWTAYRVMFWTLWDHINAKRGYSWESNPWTWVVEFKQVEKGA